MIEGAKRELPRTGPYGSVAQTKGIVSLCVAVRELAVEIREFFIPDFSTWDKDHSAYLKAFDKLIRDLQAKGEAAKA